MEQSMINEQQTVNTWGKKTPTNIQNIQKYTKTIYTNHHYSVPCGSIWTDFGWNSSHRSPAPSWLPQSLQTRPENHKFEWNLVENFRTAPPHLPDYPKAFKHDQKITIKDLLKAFLRDSQRQIDVQLGADKKQVKK